jgi:hypothetical protein
MSPLENILASMDLEAHSAYSVAGFNNIRLGFMLQYLLLTIIYTYLHPFGHYPLMFIFDLSTY